jgi:hypothetical protein
METPSAHPLHPLATGHLPMFITAPGETDTLLVVMGVFLLLMVLLIGVFYFTLHSLPERMAHRTSKVQFEIVAVLALLALFTHEHVYWIAALLLAMVSIPDFLTPMIMMAKSLEKMAGDRETPVQGPVQAQEPLIEPIQHMGVPPPDLRPESQPEPRPKLIGERA